MRLKTVTLAITLTLFFAACGGDSTSNEPVDAASAQEIEALETETQELDAVSKEMDKSEEALDSALNNLDNLFGDEN